MDKLIKYWGKVSECGKYLEIDKKRRWGSEDITRFKINDDFTISPDDGQLMEMSYLFTLNETCFKEEFEHAHS